MFKTTSEGLVAYRKELAEFKTWVDSLGYSFNPDLKRESEWGEYSPFRPNSHPGGWATRDCERITRWNARLKGMEAALGLTSDEVRSAYKEAGLRIAA